LIVLSVKRLEEVRNFVEGVRREEERLRLEVEVAHTREKASLKLQVSTLQERYIHMAVLTQ
jgi:hypothetical protein